MKNSILKISSFCETRSGGTPSRQKQERYYGGGVPWVKSGELRESIIYGTEESVTDEAIKETNVKIVPEGALLVAMYGATIGRVAILGVPAATNQAICSIIPDNKIADTKYLFHCLVAHKNQFLMLGAGGSQPNISQSIIRDTEIPLPLLAEQKRIAAILDKADAIRRKRQAAIKLADEFLRATFLDMFGDPVTNPKEWEIHFLEDHLDFLTSGSRGWAKYYSKTGKIFLRIQNVGKNELLLNETIYVQPPVNAEAKRTLVKPGDVLLSITADLGRTAVVPECLGDAYINQHLAILRLNRIEPHFLSAYLSSEGGQHQFKALNKGGVKAGLNFDDIKSLKIIVPKLSMQQKWTQRWLRINRINFQSANLAKQQEILFNSLTQRAFQGGTLK
jgi:type I restriction enzyme S subunit